MSTNGMVAANDEATPALRSKDVSPMTASSKEVPQIISPASTSSVQFVLQDHDKKNEIIPIDPTAVPFITHTGPPGTSYLGPQRVSTNSNLGPNSAQPRHKVLPLQLLSNDGEDLSYDEDFEDEETQKLYQIWVASCSNHNSVATVIEYCGQFVKIEVSTIFAFYST